MKQDIRLAAISLLALMALPSIADEKKDMFRPENASVTSQSIAPDARAGGMGDIGAATDPDVMSQYWNPAKYPFSISRAGVALNYTPWLRQLVSDMDLACLAGYYRIGDYSAVSASLRYFSLGEVYTNSSSTNDNSMTINPYEMSMDVAYSLMLSEKFSIAAAVRWIYSDLTYDYSDDTSPDQRSPLTLPHIIRTISISDSVSVSSVWALISRTSVRRSTSAVTTIRSSSLPICVSVHR